MTAPANTTTPTKIAAALLSAVGLSEPASNASGAEESTNSTALLPLAGLPFVEFQINQLSRNGIDQILLEIDSLPGSLVAMADRVRQRGVSIEFIRSPSELRDRISPDKLLFILSDGVFVDEALLLEIVGQESPFIATIDGREENAIFERIDLNSFWSGIAMLDSASVESIASLPEGWSISSSLLRRALQDSVVHRPLKQDLIVSGRLSKITSSADLEQLTRQLLHAKSSDVDGVVEKFAFAPLIARIGNAVLRSPSRKFPIEAVGGLSVLVTLGCAIAGLPVIAAAFAIVSLFSMQLGELLQTNRPESRVSASIKTASWTALASSFVAALWNWAGDPISNVFVAVIVIGQMALAFRVAKPGWIRLNLCSPTLLAALAFLFALSGTLAAGSMLVAIGQLFALIFAVKSGESIR